MYVDYSNLNHAFLKDTFPLPQIDQIIDATIRHDQLSFLDAYSGYNQIPMFPPDSANTTFIAPKGVYYYNIMPFDLKNAGKRMMSCMFEPLLRKTMEVYIDAVP